MIIFKFWISHYVKIWTRMASNNTISWSATYEILTYFRRKLGSASQIHVSTPRWFMSVFLLKSDGGTPQFIFFNVFIILKCSAVCEVDIVWRKPIGACKIQCQSLSRRLIELRWSHQDIKLDCFTVHGGTLSTCIEESAYVRCPVECGAFTGDGLTKYI